MDPWTIIAMMASAQGNNLIQSGKGATASEKRGYGYGTPQQPGMAYQAAPNMGNTAKSPSMQISNAATTLAGSPISEDMQKSAPIAGNIINGEEAALRNVTPGQAGYMQAPTTVNSSVPAYSSANPWSNIYAKYGKF